MEYIYEALRKTEQIPAAYEEWKQYREQVTSYLLSKVKHQSRIAILGAGQSNDLELRRLVEAGHELVLLDRDNSAMKQGLQRQFGEDAARVSIECRHCDIWPVTVEDYHQLEELLLQNTDMEVIVGWMKTLTKRLEQSTPDLGTGYDWLVVMGLHSQVNIMFVTLLHYYIGTFGLDYSKRDVQMYYAMVTQMNQEMTMHIQPFLMQAARRQLFAYEYGSFEPGEEQIYDVLNLFRQGRADCVQKLGISRVEGALQWEQLLSKEYAQQCLQIRDWNYLVWPFCKDKQYLMVFYECCKAGL
ncbi:MAG: hypothetical protein PUC39_08780 [Lachnospiraceae bacterium]|nr:hypothetical protein [Lachnospiraceae bacterium]